MPNDSGLYNLGGGQVTPTSQQRQVLPFGEATRRRQTQVGRVLPGEIDWAKRGEEDASKDGGIFNILELLKVPLGLLGGLFGGGEGRFGLRRGRTSPEERLEARQRQFGQDDYDYYSRYRESLPGGRRMGPPSPSPSPSVGRGSSSPTIINVP